MTRGPMTEMVSEPNSSHPYSVTIRTVGWTWLDKWSQVVILSLFPIGVLFVIYLSGARPPVNLPLQLTEIIIFLGLLDFAFAEMTSVRSVTLGPEGVRFRFMVHSEVRQWRDLEPGPGSPEHQGWWLVSRRRGAKPTRQRGYRITIAQAQMILSYPSCPRWELKPVVQAALGLATASS